MFRKSSFNVILFLFVFFLLETAFTVYVGILSPGGKIYSPFLDRYANVPAWFTYFICKCAKALLQLSGYNVYQKALNNITITGSRGVNIIWACLGFGVMSFWTAFVISHSAGWKYKLKWVLTGLSIITGINIIRIALIALGLHHNWKVFNAIEPHFAFNVVCYIAIFSLTVWFVMQYKTYRKNYVKLNV